MSEPTVTVSISIHAPAKEVWEALTDPDDIKKYFMGATVKTDWQVGSPITWSGDWKGKAYQDKGEILAFEPEKKLSYSHWSPMGGTDDVPQNYHVVTITLHQAGAHTDVTLAQSNLKGGITAADREHRGEYEKNWNSVLQGLKATVED